MIQDLVEFSKALVGLKLCPQQRGGVAALIGGFGHCGGEAAGELGVDDRPDKEFADLGVDPFGLLVGGADALDRDGARDGF